MSVSVCDDVHYQTEQNLSIFSERDLINYDSSLCSRILSAIDFQCHVFSFWKAFAKCPSLSVNNIFDDVRFDDVRYDVTSTLTMLQCWAKFSNALVHWSIGMIPAKNYETASKFVKVMPKTLWPLFSGHGVLYTSACLLVTYISVFTARCTSAQHGIEIACRPSVRPSVCLWRWWIRIT